MKLLVLAATGAQWVPAGTRPRVEDHLCITRVTRSNWRHPGPICLWAWWVNDALAFHVVTSIN